MDKIYRNDEELLAELNDIESKRISIGMELESNPAMARLYEDPEIAVENISNLLARIAPEDKNQRVKLANQAVEMKLIEPGIEFQIRKDDDLANNVFDKVYGELERQVMMEDVDGTDIPQEKLRALVVVEFMKKNPQVIGAPTAQGLEGSKTLLERNATLESIGQEGDDILPQLVQLAEKELQLEDLSHHDRLQQLMREQEGLDEDHSLAS